MRSNWRSVKLGQEIADGLAVMGHGFLDKAIILLRDGIGVAQKVPRGDRGRSEGIPFSEEVPRGVEMGREGIPFSEEVPRRASGLTRAVPRDSLRKLVRMIHLVCRKLDGRTKARDRDPDKTGTSGR
jgi:hypothetical protein